MGDFERVKNSVSLRDYAAANLAKSRGGMWCCPNCGSGTRGTRNSDGALSIARDGQHWKCFSCGEGGDIFDLAGIVRGVSDKRDQLQVVADWAGITIESEAEPRRNYETASPRPLSNAGSYGDGRRSEADYIKHAQAAIGNPEAVKYLASRGLTLDDAKAAGIGYDAQRKRIVLPWPGEDYYHIDRAISDGVNPKYTKPKSEQVGEQPLYNLSAIEQPAYFVVEGVFDAIVVRLCGFEAVALASNTISSRNTAELAEAITSRDSAGVAVVMLDNDSAGNDGAVKVCAALGNAGITCVRADVPQDAPKDAAEWYKNDKAGLREYLEAQHAQAVEAAQSLRERAYLDALKSLRVIEPGGIASSIYLLRESEEPTPTGLKVLDDALDGGLRGGLYALGAISSLGKTTLAVQIADYIAEHGRGVLFVTIEQGANEIVAKSLSRYTRTLKASIASATEVMSKARRERWTEGQTEAFYSACEHYMSNVAPRLKILEGTRQPSVADVASVARIMQQHDGRAPVVFVDYLQLLAAPNEHDTDKQATDKNVMALRQLARDLKTPVFAISSLNRSSYSYGVTLDSFKESGAVEYGCDVLLGLQPLGIQDAIEAAPDSKRGFEKIVRKHKAGEKRDCELVVLKNRNGRVFERGIPITFEPLSSLYTEPAPRKSNVPII